MKKYHIRIFFIASKTKKILELLILFLFIYVYYFNLSTNTLLKKFKLFNIASSMLKYL